MPKACKFVRLSQRPLFDQPRTVSQSASVAFEQSYGPIDGDSASAAELIAILSAIADVPLKQSIAITGSINQRGAIQPIGGADEKNRRLLRYLRDARPLRKATA